MCRCPIAKRVCISLFFGFTLGTLVSLGAEAYWPDFYEMAKSKKTAKNTALDSKDAGALKRAGVYFFALVNGINQVQIEKGNRSMITNAKMAKDYFDAAHRLELENPMLMTWRALATLSYADVSPNLFDTVKYANAGINYLNQVPLAAQGNLDYLFLKIATFSEVPLTFKNLSEEIIYDSDRYFALFRSLESVPEYYHGLYEAIKIMKAKAIFYSKHRDKPAIRALLKDVDIELLHRTTQGRDTLAGEYYKMLKKKMKMN